MTYRNKKYIIDTRFYKNSKSLAENKVEKEYSMIEQEYLNSATETDVESDVYVSSQDTNHVKMRNVSSVFNTIERNPGITRSRITQKTGLSMMTVSKIIETFARKGVIIQYKSEGSSSVQQSSDKTVVAGRKASLLYIDYSNSYAIVDLSSYNFSFCIYNIKKERMLKYVHQYDTALEFTQNLKKFLFKCRYHLEAYTEKYRVFALGVSLPGPYDSTTDKIVNKRMPELNSISITKTLEFGLMMPVTFIDENVKLSIYAHMQTIPQYEDKQLLYLHIGDGVGGGIAFNGQIIRGAGKFAGDMGQLILNDKGKTLEQIIKSPESDEELKEGLKSFFYNAMWFYNPDVFIIEYDAELNPYISKDLFQDINLKEMFDPMTQNFPEMIVTDEIKKSHLGLGSYICNQWYKRILSMSDRFED